MKAQMLKLAGVKTEAAFYKKYPTQEAFMKVHGKAFKKAQIGTYIGGEAAATPKPINFNDAYDQVDLSITGKTNDMRKEEMYKQAALAADQKQAQGGGDMFSQIGGALGNLGTAFGGEAEYGAYIPKAQVGGNYFQKNNPYFMQNPGPINNQPQVQNGGPMGSNLTPVGQTIPNATMSVGKLPNSVAAPAQSSTMDKIGGAIGKYAGPAGQIIQGIGALKAQKNALKQAKQTRQLSDLALDASKTRPEQSQRRYVRPEDMVTSGNQVGFTQGTGTNVLSKNGKTIHKAKGGAEIQNTYAPGTLYDDLGYEPLNDSDEVKQYANGGFPWDAAGDFGSNVGGAIVGQDAGSQIGGTIGGTLGNLVGGPIGGAIGKTLGTVAGGLLDTTDRDMRKQQSATDRNMQAMAFGQGAQSLQAQNSAVMEDGGYVSHDWTPQLITKFGDYDLEDLLAPDETMDTLRAGGHLRAYKEPSERAMQTFAMGGELQTHWGGHMEEMSQNPYLPDGGVTYMPHGQSHEESDGNGRTGIGITYGDNPVEVERREPIMKLRDGSTGEDNLVVFGNLEIPKYGVELLGDKKAKGMKFKNYVADLSKSETKQNKTIQKSAEKLADFDPKDSFDKLKFAGLQANILGGNMKLKEIAQTKEKAAALQNAINDTAEEMGFDADSLAKGRVKMAKYGGEFSMAQKGKKVKGKNVKSKPLAKFKKPDIVDNMEIPSIPKLARTEAQIAADEDKYSRMQSGIVGEDYDDMIKVSPISDDVLNPKKETVDLNPYVNAINSVIPTLRPSNAEELDGRQLYGEMYALSQNQEEPVQAQQFSPQLANTYSISLQDQMNEITAQTRAAQRMAQNNPAAQAAIAAQAYEAINKVKGEEFRMNQGLANQVQTANIAAMNDAQLKNLGILDQQYTRQAQARSNTKAVAQAALNSISDKYAKNSLENRTLQTYENMYNYRYDKAGRLINMNPLAQWDVSGLTSGKAGGKDVAPEGYEYETILKKKKADKSKNGSIVKAIRNL
jgi:hypothetical protein